MSHGNGMHGMNGMMHTTQDPMHMNMTDDGGPKHGGHTPGGHTPSGHNTYFYISNQATILFIEWTVSTWQMMLVTCMAVALVSALYEGLKIFREELLQRHNKKQKEVGCRVSACSLAHLVQTLFHVIQVTVSYCLMMVFMTFNVWLCIAVVAGAGLGYLAFGWRRVTLLHMDTTEHCN